MAIEGFNSTVFCYGQTGSGKTHTLTGPPNLVNMKLCIIYDWNISTWVRIRLMCRFFMGLGRKGVTKCLEIMTFLRVDQTYRE